MPLEKYREKRDFEKTPEPPPGEARAEGALMFVIQKHAATRLHYDFRLEFGGVLKSWPTPKGPSLNPRDKRLAVMVEDHPVEYASFEGAIPKGEYGAGQVIVWDAGTYSPDEGGLVFDDRERADRRMQEGLANGKLSFFLRGHKLKGSFTLVRIGQGRKDEVPGKDWLLIKHKDRFADPERDVTLEDASVISGLKIADIKGGRLPDRSVGRLIVRPGDLRGVVAAPFPKSVETMQATLTEKPFSSTEWYFEPKLDGVRMIALIHEGKGRLLSRRGIEATKTYPGIVAELAEQPSPGLVLDGEIVALDENGVPSFQRLQRRLGLQREADIRLAEVEIPVLYYVFDILYAEGYDLRRAPLAERKGLLDQMVMPGEFIRLAQHFEQDGVEAYRAAVGLGLEGVIAKRRDSVYESGRRSHTWLKIKATQEQEFVVGGYTGGEGGRASTFGSLLLGYYEGGRLRYAGNVGTGFDDWMLRTLTRRLDALRTDTNPFAGEIKRGPATFRRPKNVPVYFVKPELVAEVKFAQWTDEQLLRAPSFLRLREDKAAREVSLEQPTPAPQEAVLTAAAGAPTDEAARVLDQLQNKAEKFILSVGGHKIPLTNLEKTLWPEFEGRRALTKRDLLQYLARVSPWLLPHMRDRPITLTRYPNGIRAKHFYQKHWEAKLPEFVETVKLWSDQNEGDGDYLICDNLPTLLWLGQLADIELHTWYSRVSPEADGHHLPATFTGSRRSIERSLLNYPDFIVFDLDPYIYSGNEEEGAEPELNRKAFQKTCEVGLWLKDLLDSMSLSSFVKTTGKTGLHVYVPILRRFDYPAVRGFAETIGKHLVARHPRDITMQWAVEKRTGKVFFDHNQNTRGKTLASVYSPRPSPEAAVSMPILWDELKDIYPPDFTILTAPDRLGRMSDLWGNILAEKHDLGALLGIAED